MSESEHNRIIGIVLFLILVFIVCSMVMPISEFISRLLNAINAINVH